MCYFGYDAAVSPCLLSQLCGLEQCPTHCLHVMSNSLSPLKATATDGRGGMHLQTGAALVGKHRQQILA